MPPADVIRDMGPDLAVDVGTDNTGPDTFAPRPGQGALSGACGVLDEETWESEESMLVRNVLDFGQEAFDESLLSAGGKEILADDNLGGSSLHSEIFAFEVLHRCELAELIKTEREIAYDDPAGKKTDLLVSIDGRKIGVSVTRAFHYPAGEPYTEAEASALLDGKLADALASEQNAAAVDRWQRSLLHILAFDSQHAELAQAAYEKVDPAVRGSTLVVITSTEGNDDHLYVND